MKSKRLRLIGHCYIFTFLFFQMCNADSQRKNPYSHVTQRHQARDSLPPSNENKNNHMHSSEDTNFLQGFSEYEIVVPIRVHHNTGVSFSHGRHFFRRSKKEDSPVPIRKKRDLKYENIAHDIDGNLSKFFEIEKTNNSNINNRNFSSRSGSAADKTNKNKRKKFSDHNVANFSVSAFGEIFLLNLISYDDFLAPYYSIRYFGDDNVQNKSTENPRHCFYAGEVNGIKHHRAVLSLCQGMFGAFRTEDHEYLIQPEVVSSKPYQNPNDEEGTKAHKIFRRNARNDKNTKKSMCGYEENENLKREDVPNHSSVEQLLNTINHPTRNEFVKATNPIKNITTKQEVKQSSTLNFEPSLQKLFSAFKQFQDSKQLNEKENNTRSSTRSKPKSNSRTTRKKRSLSQPHTIEVMVTADNTLAKAHADIEHYVLTLMAIVHHIFLDPSIGNAINLVVVELVVIGDSQVNNGPQVVKHAQTCLRNFCQWQFEHNNPDDSHPIHHDTAILITGKDICRTDNACDTLGLAELGTMCNSRRSCSINEDNGLSTSFTIAHELGHLFNAPHDDSSKCSEIEGRDDVLNVMSPTLDNNAQPWSWSKCSRKFITEFLDNRRAECLLDDPPPQTSKLPSEAPGSVFDADEQCEFIYGPGSRHCSFMFQNNCKRLWCVSKEVEHGCRTPHLPWADGTSCGDQMWCQRGNCVPQILHRSLIDGNWGAWSAFGECSRTCGGGVSTAERKCDNPRPANNGQYCIGKRKKFRSCNQQACFSDSGFRAEQCSSYNNWQRFRSQRIRGIPSDAEWIPKYDGISEENRCKLTCQIWSADGRPTSWYVLRSRVIDGTPCDPNFSDVCVEGKCQKAGCDHVIGSSATEDSCGVCGGDDRSCTQVRGSYNAGHKLGYNNVTRITAGATNIVITQQSHTGDRDDNNYLALRDSSGNYILNGNRSVMKNKQTLSKRIGDGSGRYLYNCFYTGTGSAVEVVNCTQATRIDIIVEVLSAGDLIPPNIHFQYKIPKEKKRIFRWKEHGDWTPCTSICNGKTKKRIFCLSENDEVVSDLNCLNQPKPTSIIRLCNTDCAFKWFAKPGRCSARCGPGTLLRNYQCWKVKNIIIQNGRDEFSREHQVSLVNKRFCPDEKPSAIATCQGECLPTRWHYSAWGECSVSCGGGTQRRKVECRDSNNEKLGFQNCGGNHGGLSRNCGSLSCPSWMTSAFSPCSATCGSGTRRKKVWCSSQGRATSSHECPLSSKPRLIETCVLHPCPKWVYGPWGPCSSTCGEGISVRLHRCIDHTRRVIHPSHCDVTSLQDTKPCFSPTSCGGLSWSSSDTDGSPFIITRRTSNRDVALQSRVNEEVTTVPPTPKIYNHLPLSEDSSDTYPDVSVVNARRIRGRWRTGSWTQCSTSCGTGIRLRYVSCRHLTRRMEVDDDACGGEGNRPPSTESCFHGPCYGKWRTGKWSRCSTTCGHGFRTRYVTCLYGNRYYDDELHCNKLEKPEQQEDCSLSLPCTTQEVTDAVTSESHFTTSTERVSSDSVNITEQNLPYLTTSVMRTSRKSVGRWKTGKWSRCSVSCGEGVQIRKVVCNYNVSCDPDTRPSHVRSCNNKKCASWFKGKWSRCSRPCGGGNRTRTVYCQNLEGGKLDDRFCNSKRRPKDHRPCNVKQCRKKYHWWRSDWSTCSSTCGRGTKTRTVHCADKLQRKVNDEKCVNLRKPKPRDVRHCRSQQRCPRWRTKPWTECSSSCGPGFQSRPIRCKYKRKVIVDQLCDARKRPPAVRPCNTTKCPAYQWSIGDWSECSTSCGVGMRERQVVCRNTQNRTIVDYSYCSFMNEQPLNVTECSSKSCASFWATDPWDECSQSCNPGYQKRVVKCIYIDPKNYTETEAHDCNAYQKPYDVRDCNRGSCQSRVFWRVGTWSKCSSSCGAGSSVRKVVCSDQKTLRILPDAVCHSHPSFRPDTTRHCRGPPCVPNTCLELKKQQFASIDGEYPLNVGGKTIQIYCHGMNGLTPLEFITLTPGEENFSEIFGFRLIKPDACPNNGSRPLDCACHRDHPDEGLTMFSKVRIDVKSMRLIGSDFTFAKIKFGNPVSYGEAGDCYSRSSCPQGSFRVNLSGTGLVVSSNTEWESYGIDPSRRIRKTRSGAIVSGQCGGYCSRCRPHPHTGLIVEHEVR